MSPRNFTRAVLLLLALLGASGAFAQTIVNASQAQSCAGTRFGATLGCTANDFTSSATFSQTAAQQIATCTAGTYLTLSVNALITSNSPTRYNGGLFFGENDNDPSINNAANTCSVATFPTTPNPFLNLDGNTCGDFQSTSSTTLEVDNIRVLCKNAPGTNTLGLPYVLVFDNAAGTPTSCSLATITAPTKSKCVANPTATIVTSAGTPVTVNGYLTVNTVVSPAGTTFSYTAQAKNAANANVTTTPSSFTQGDGGSQQIIFPLDSTGGNDTVAVSQTAQAGWATTISCVDQSGTAQPSWVVGGAISAVLNGTTYGGTCTITNTRLAQITIRDQSLGGTAAFSFTGGTNGLPASLTLDTTVANPATSAGFFVTANGTATAITQTIPAGYTLTASCTDGTTTFGSLAGGTLTIPAANVVSASLITCTFVDTAKATFTKAFSPTSVINGAPSTLTFTVTNSSGSPAQTGLSFTDTFVAGLLIATPLNVTNTCGGSLFNAGTGTPLSAGANGLTLSGGSLASGTASCTIAVNVSASAAGTYNNGPAQISGVSGGLTSAVTNQTLTVTIEPVITLSATPDAPTKAPGTTITVTLTAANVGQGVAKTVVLTSQLDRYEAFSLNAYGAGAPFKFTDGTPTSGLTLGTPQYSSNGGTTYTYTPVSGGGGAPAGYDGLVTNWRIPMTGTMNTSSSCTVQYQAIIK